MTTAITHATLPMAIFRGPHHARVASSAAWRDLFRELPDRLREILDETARVGKRSEVRLSDDDRALRLVVDPLPDEELLATVIDETELVHARAEAASARRHKERLLSAVSHDLRAPMSTILLWERILRDRFDEPEVRRRALDAIHDSAASQSTLVGQLVELSSLMRDANQLVCEHIAVEAVLSHAIDIHWTPAKSKLISFKSDYPDPLGFVRADPQLLRQVFGNVLETLVRISPRGSTVTIHARHSSDRIVIEIGPITSGQSQLRAEQVAMLDLGLIISAELIAMHAGTFEAVRAGAVGVPTFVISLPMSTRLSPSI